MNDTKGPEGYGGRCALRGLGKVRRYAEDCFAFVYESRDCGGGWRNPEPLSSLKRSYLCAFRDAESILFSR